jgi:tyrosyl-tRNA synthetase
LSAGILKVFRERGFIEQVTDEDGLERLFENSVTCYIGFDPTAKSLHVGSLVPIMALAHIQREGHRPIALIGGGTGLIGDPSGKTEARKILSIEEINENSEALRNQLSRFIDFKDGKAFLLNNSEWLVPLKYIEFLRDIGKYFSVNRMLTMESIKNGLQRGLSFIEFNYPLLQAYDFWYLFKFYDCKLQMGGSDQWGNIVAGIDLIRRIEGKEAYGITFPLIETSSGQKMGKTEKGTVWLDPKLTSPYEYYQFWINTDDRDVMRFLSLFTFLPMEEIKKVGDMKGAELNIAKTVLAFEATRINHGIDMAIDAYRSSISVFGMREIPSDLFQSSKIPRRFENMELASIPTTIIKKERLKKGISAYELFEEVGLCETRGEARRLLAQGGGYIWDRRIPSYDTLIDEKSVQNGYIILRKGKKTFHRIIIE